MANCDNLHLLRSDWSNMSLIQVSYPHVILFLLLFGFIYFGMYFLSDVSPINIFSSAVLEPKIIPSEIGNIISLCRFCTDIWSRFFCFFIRVQLFLTRNEYFKLGELLHEIDFQFMNVIHWLLFQKIYFILFLRKTWCNNPINIWLQLETFVLISMNSIIHCTYWTSK